MLGEESKAKEIKRLCDEGKSLLSISEELDLSVYYIKTLMTKYNIVKRKVYKADIKSDRVVELFKEQNLSAGIIAKRLGISTTIVNKILLDKNLIQHKYKKTSLID